MVLPGAVRKPRATCVDDDQHHRHEQHVPYQSAATAAAVQKVRARQVLHSVGGGMNLPAGMTRVVLVPRTGARINCLVARSLWLRSRGLLGRPHLPPRTGMLIERCSSVHTVGMTYAIDVVFLAADFRVLRVVPGLQPLRAAWYPHASYALELGESQASAAGILAGEWLRPLTTLHHVHDARRASRARCEPSRGLPA